MPYKPVVSIPSMSLPGVTKSDVAVVSGISRVKFAILFFFPVFPLVFEVLPSLVALLLFVTGVATVVTTAVAVAAEAEAASFNF